MSSLDRKIAVTYTPEVALEICTWIAEGKSLTFIEKQPDMPTRKTIYKWLSVYPKFFDAFERAREVSAMSFEENALQIAQDLVDVNDFTGTKVSALNYAMQQLRWTASRRDPKRYGQKAETSTTIPIQINTTLNLAQDGQPLATDEKQSIYRIEATVNAQPALPPPDDVPDADDGDVVELEETDERAFGLPDTEKEQLHAPKIGRPPGRKQGPRKNAAQTKRTATLAAKRLKDKE